MSSPFVCRAVCAALNLAIFTLADTSASAQQATAPEPATSVAAQTAADAVVPLPPIDVESPAPATPLISAPLTSTSLTQEQIRNWRVQTNDTARLLQSIAGISLYDTGGVSGLPVIHGLADDRVNTLVNGVPLPSACPNHMNPPLSYIDPSNVGDVTAITGVTPVSRGGDSIAGTVIVNSPAPAFAAPGQTLLVSGATAGFYRSNADTFATSVGSTIANDAYSLNYSGAFVTAANYHGGGDDGKLRSSEYRAFNQAVTGAARGADDLAALQFGQQYIPYQGFPTSTWTRRRTSRTSSTAPTSATSTGDSSTRAPSCRPSITR